MATLAAIMREQQDEKLAREIYEEEEKFIKQQEALFNRFTSDEELAKFLAEQEQVDGDENEKEEKKDDNDVVSDFQSEEDLKLALKLQADENRKLNQIHTKNFSPLEQKMYQMQINQDIYDEEEEEDAEYDSEEDEEEDVDENGEPIDKRLHDRSQRKEDKELSFVYKRHPDKNINKIMSGNMLPLHHQDFRTRNKGKDGSRVVSSNISKKKKYQAIREFRIKGENEVYALVTKKLGGNHLDVYCYDGHTRMVTIPGKLNNVAWINVGDFVLVKIRTYQESRGEIQLKYTPEEHEKLVELGEINAINFTQTLPNEVSGMIMSLLDSLSTSFASAVSKQLNTIVQQQQNVALVANQTTNPIIVNDAAK